MDYPLNGEKKTRRFDGGIRKYRKIFKRKKWQGKSGIAMERKKVDKSTGGDRHTIKIEVAKEKVYNEFYVRLDIKEG